MIYLKQINLYKSYTRIIHTFYSRLIQVLFMAKKSVRFNVMLTEEQFQRLKDYAEQEDLAMADVIRSFIKTLSIKKKKSIE